MSYRQGHPGIGYLPDVRRDIFQKELLAEFKDSDEEQKKYTQAYLELLAANLHDKMSSPGEKRV